MSGISQAVALWPDRDPIYLGANILVTFSFNIESSSITLSIRRRDALSRTSTFHYIIYCQVGLRGREGFEGTDVAMGNLSDGGQDDCVLVSAVPQEQGLVRRLTLPLGIQDRDHGRRRWADGRVTMLAERLVNRLQGNPYGTVIAASG
jgi:hypothetical protein